MQQISFRGIVCLKFYQFVVDLWMIPKPRKTDVTPGTQSSIFLG